MNMKYFQAFQRFWTSVLAYRSPFEVTHASAHSLQLLQGF
jgi:hypothetical protein